MTLYRSAARSLVTTGVSLGHRQVSEADHWILSLDPAPTLACTHLVQAPFPHVAISVTSAAPSDTAPSDTAPSDTAPSETASFETASFETASFKTASFKTADDLRAGADAAAAGKFGRAVVFPGSSGLTGRLTVAELLERTAIDRVEILGSGAADPGQIVDTRDFVRPQYRGDDLVLVTMPAAGRVLVPFETRDPTPCCADHG
ncbi:MAG: hypothetical protein SYR96_03950 [Actinomycetota bacterium]|nr:hypothetical protein [Actinomycetota bacterium]